MKAQKPVDLSDRYSFRICFICYGKIHLNRIIDYDEYLEEEYMCEDCQMLFLKRKYKPGVEVTNSYVRQVFGLPVL